MSCCCVQFQLWPYLPLTFPYTTTKMTAVHDLTCKCWTKRTKSGLRTQTILNHWVLGGSWLPVPIFLVKLLYYIVCLALFGFVFFFLFVCVEKLFWNTKAEKKSRTLQRPTWVFDLVCPKTRWRYKENCVACQPKEDKEEIVRISLRALNFNHQFGNNPLW